jgi:hypothetical protein
MTSRLESGATYCLAAILLVVTVSLNDPGIYDIGSGIAQQLIASPGSFRMSGLSSLPIPQNIIPTFTLVYVGMKNTDYSHSTADTHQIPHTSSRSTAVPSSQPCEVLDIKPQSAEEKAGEYV